MNMIHPDYFIWDNTALKNIKKKIGFYLTKS